MLWHSKETSQRTVVSIAQQPKKSDLPLFFLEITQNLFPLERGWQNVKNFARLHLFTK